LGIVRAAIAGVVCALAGVGGNRGRANTEDIIFLAARLRVNGTYRMLFGAGAARGTTAWEELMEVMKKGDNLRV
jgi:hypothetical protein